MLQSIHHLSARIVANVSRFANKLKEPGSGRLIEANRQDLQDCRDDDGGS